MKNKIIVLLSILLLLLSVVAIVVLVIKDNKQDIKIDVKYAVTSTKVEDNKAMITVMAGVFSGKAVDPFSNVRLVDNANSPYYPINGFKKPSLNKGDSLAITFEFFNPGTVDNILEIRNSSGDITKIDITLPEIVQKTTTNIKVTTKVAAKTTIK